MIGREISHYRIVAPLGRGGMGEVYRAEDLRLGREVALKILPAELAQDAERMARLEREARTLARLQHAHIASIHGFESDGSDQALVMELVPGSNLAELIRRGPLAIDRALRIARQVALALEAAHGVGIVHRDLKPQNVMVTDADDGLGVKVIDFGLARTIVANDPASPGFDDLPTASAGPTTPGTVLGTAAYMAPEQARGRPVDKLADVWAFGVVLWEMLTGRRLFARDSEADTLAAVLEADIDLRGLPAETPAPVVRLLRRCLERNPHNRLHDLADARIVLDEVLAGDDEATAPEHRPAPAGRQRTTWRWLALTGVLGLVALVPWLGSWLTPRAPSDGRSPGERRLEFAIDVAPVNAFDLSISSAVALSPDARRLVFVGGARTAGPQRLLYRRDLQVDATQPIPGTEQAEGIFFSPGGDWVAYAQRNALRKAPFLGGPPTEIVAISNQSRGGTWLPDGRIVYAPSWYSELWIISEDGAGARPLTELRPGEKSHRHPTALPDGSAVLFVVIDRAKFSFDEATIEAVVVATGERKVLFEGGGAPRFLPPDTLLVPRDGQLLAVRFDPHRLETSGLPRVVRDDLATDSATGTALFDVAADGTLVYFPGGTEAYASNLARQSFDGTETVLDTGLDRPAGLSLSPEGGRLAIMAEGANPQIFVYDLARSSLTRISHDRPHDAPAWSLDGRSVFTCSAGGGTYSIHRLNADGTGEPEEIWSETGRASCPRDVGLVAGREQLMVSSRVLGEADDLYWLDPESGELTLYVGTRFSEHLAALSPDDRWVAYMSNESGRDEVYVQSAPEAGRRWQVSTHGGTLPRWSPKGDRLFYFHDGTLLAADIRTEGDSLWIGEPVAISQLPGVVSDETRTVYEILPDGTGLVAVRRSPNSNLSRLRVVLGAGDLLRASDPTAP